MLVLVLFATACFLLGLAVMGWPPPETPQ